MISELKRPCRLVLSFLLVLGAIFAVSTEVWAQEAGSKDIHIHQVASSSHNTSGLPDPETSTDRQAATLWPQLSCAGLGATAAECVLSSSAPLASGGGNTATIVQHGNDNIAEIIQRGTGNTAVTSQDGHSNELYATQIGDDNLIGVRLVGNDNLVDVLQDGNDNTYLLNFQGDDLDHSVEQRGHDLRLIQLGQGTLPFSVEQQGTDMTIRIEHNPLSVWPR